MKALIGIQLKSILTVRFIITGLSISFLLGMVQAMRLSHELLIKNEQGNLTDFILYALGGWQYPMTILSIIQWLMLILLVLLVSQWSYIGSHAWVIMVINRYKSRVYWWFSNCIAQLFICILVILIIITGHLIAGTVFFDNYLGWGSYTLKQYFFASDPNPIPFLVVGFFTLLSGMYALVLLQMVVKNIFYIEGASMILFMILILLGFAYIYHHLPRILSPVFYPSVVASIQTGLKSHLYVNLGLCIILFMLGILVIRKKDIP